MGTAARVLKRNVIILFCRALWQFLTRVCPHHFRCSLPSQSGLYAPGGSPKRESGRDFYNCLQQLQGCVLTICRPFCTSARMPNTYHLPSRSHPSSHRHECSSHGRPPPLPAVDHHANQSARGAPEICRWFAFNGIAPLNKSTLDKVTRNLADTRALLEKGR